nr:MFS transporter [Vibrio sonorensis]
MKLALFTLMFTVLLSTLDFVMMIPIGPQIAIELGLEVEKSALLITAYPIFAAIAGVLLAPYADKFGRKTILIMLLLTLSFSAFGTASSDSYFSILICRAVAGLSGGILMPTLSPMPVTLGRVKGKLKPLLGFCCLFL